MSCSPLASDMIAAIRDRVKPYIHGGTWLSSDEVYFLVKNLNTAHAVAIETEDEKSCLERRIRLGSPIPIAQRAGGNVVAFPAVKPRLTLVSNNDGGDAA